MRHVVVGVGVNVNHVGFPPELKRKATSLHLASGRVWPRAEIVLALLRALDSEYYNLRRNTAQSRQELLRRFEAHSSMVHGRSVRVVDAASSADAPLTGMTAGLDDHGFLLLRTEEGVQPVLAGSIAFLDE